MNESDDSPIPQWNVGGMSITSSKTKSLLGQPSYVETDPRATAGGTEEHWTILFSSSLSIFLRHRNPYDQLDVCIVARRIPADFREIIAKVIPGYKFKPVERPFDETRHPEDPLYYYEFDKA